MTVTVDAVGMKFQEAKRLVESNPAAARGNYRARVDLDSGTQCSAYVRKFPALIVDEPPSLGGNDAGPNPVELLLVALGACKEIAYSISASMMGIELDSVSVKLKGQLDFRGVMGDKSVPPGYQEITYETRIESQADPEKIAELVRTVEAICPTLDTLRRPVEVSGHALLNGDPVAVD